MNRFSHRLQISMYWKKMNERSDDFAQIAKRESMEASNWI